MKTPLDSRHVAAMRRFVSDRVAVAAFLLIATFAVYWQAGGNEFIAYDDDLYVFDNPFVRGTFSLATLKWAFTTFHAANWHPLTWLSHILDAQLFGLNPAGHHLMSVALHAVNAVMLFLLLVRLTAATWRSAVVAALFALHPLHVESVAWAAERKDVLSTLFYLLSLYFYAGYAEHRNTGRYILVLSTLAIGLMAKPMLVSIPLVMLLMDYWPLKRFEARADTDGQIPGSGGSSYWCLLKEKIPFLVLVAISSIVTLYAQHNGSAITTLENTPLTTRLGNAVLAYQGYLEKMFWPRGLAVFYPYPEALAGWQVLGAIGLLSAVTIMAIRQRRNMPYLMVGWFWYLGSLLPVIGIVRVGLQSMADRYTYIPLTGIFIMLVWWVSDVSKGWAGRRSLLAALSIVVLISCSVLTWRQLAYWKNSTALFTHALDVTQYNYIAHCILGDTFEQEGTMEKALAHFNAAVSIAPWSEYARIKQGTVLKNQGRLYESGVVFNDIIVKNPNSNFSRINLGIIMALQGRLEEALYNFEIAVKLDPRSAAGHYNMGLTLSKLGRQNEAIEQYQKALRLDPSNAECHNNLGILFMDQGNIDEAIQEFAEAVRLKPDFVDAISNQELALKLRQASR